MNSSSPVPTRLLRATAGAARVLLILLGTAWLLFALVLGALHGWIVPRIDQFRPSLEKHASRALGVPVRIGALGAESDGIFPTFELRDVSLLDPQGREALRLPRVVVTASPRSVLGLGFEQIYVERPQLDVRRAVDGRITVAGLDFSRGDPADTGAQDWFFSQPEFVIRGGTLRWTDESRGAPTLSLSAVDLVARNSARRHALRLDATPPAEWGERFSLMGQFRQPLLTRRSGDWQAWDGQLFADFSRVDLSELRRHADIGADIREGLGAVRAWADVARGEIRGLTADVALAEVDVKLGAHLEPLILRAVGGRLGGRVLDNGFEFSTEGLSFDTADGLHWPGGNVFVRYQGPEGPTARGELRADRLDLAALGQIANRLPLAAEAHRLLRAHAPRGRVESLQASWSGPASAPVRYEARGVVKGLEVAAQAESRTPGVRGAGIDFELTQTGGKARLAIEQGAVEVPGAFEDPVVPIDSLVGTVQWKVDGPHLSLQVSGLRFANADAQGEAQLSWHTSDPATSSGKSRFPGVLDLSGTFSRAEGTRVWRYLPAHLPKDVRYYVRDAITQGKASDVKFRVKGDLHDMPFPDGKRGEFRIGGQVRDVNFSYVPRSSAPAGGLPWPALTQLAGELVFEGTSMRVNGATARIAGAPALQVARADARIPDLARNSTVLVEGSIKGPLADALRVVNGSPLSTLTGQVLSRATANGNADVQLDLTLPIHGIDKSKVAGSVTLAGNDLQFTPDTPALGRARGVIGFSETGFTVTNGQARMLGGDVRIEGGTRPGTGESMVALRAQGVATAEGLRAARELGVVSRLAQSATGSATYVAALNFRRGVPELSVTSSLQGLGLNLPAPLSKAADQPLPLRFDNTLLRDGSGGGPMVDQLVLELGRVVNVSYVRDVSGAQPRVLRGAIGVGLAPGESAPMPEHGVLANLQFGEVNLDAWESLLSRAAGASVAAAASGTESNFAQGYLPSTVALRASDLLFEGRRLHGLVAGGSREGGLWRANLEASELGGYLEYRQPTGPGAGAGGRLYARLARASIAPNQASDVEALLDQQPDSLPALDIVIDDFELRGRKFGRVEIDAVNRASSGGAREWRLNKLNVSTPEASLAATGNWVALGAQAGRTAARGPERRRTVMNFRLDIANGGDLLARLGMKDVIRRGKGRMEGQVAWLGSPFSLDYPSMNGQFSVNVEEGQFLKADPGLAKLLGVLSLQSLPRRLTLDFRDVFSEGFAYDFIRGDVRIEQGVATTNNLQMKGVNAAVLMEGQANIAAETQSLRVVVVPEINAGTASLVATAINPAIGVGTFLAQLFLRRPLMQAATQEFQVDGTWADPRITRVERKLNAPLPPEPKPLPPLGATSEPARAGETP
jgi:uncharacterized protein (TIGR02099 family)